MAGTPTPAHYVAAATHSSAGWQPDSTAYTGIPVHWDLILQAGVTPALALIAVWVLCLDNHC